MEQAKVIGNIDIAELKRLHSQIANIKFGGIGGRIVNAFPALIARLEAAEAAMQWRCHKCGIGPRNEKEDS